MDSWTDPGLQTGNSQTIAPTSHSNSSLAHMPKVCMAVGCSTVLADQPRYCQNRRLCVQHLKAVALQRKNHGDQLWRFCQQCGKLEPLSAFDGTKRSCRVQLARRRAATIRCGNSCGSATTSSGGTPAGSSSATAAATAHLLRPVGGGIRKVSSYNGFESLLLQHEQQPLLQQQQQQYLGMDQQPAQLPQQGQAALETKLKEIRQRLIDTERHLLLLQEQQQVEAQLAALQQQYLELQEQCMRQQQAAFGRAHTTFVPTTAFSPPSVGFTAEEAVISPAVATADSVFLPGFGPQPVAPAAAASASLPLHLSMAAGMYGFADPAAPIAASSAHLPTPWMLLQRGSVENCSGSIRDSNSCNLMFDRQSHSVPPLMGRAQVQPDATTAAAGAAQPAAAMAAQVSTTAKGSGSAGDQLDGLDHLLHNDIPDLEELLACGVSLGPVEDSSTNNAMAVGSATHRLAPAAGCGAAGTADRFAGWLGSTAAAAALQPAAATDNRAMPAAAAASAWQPSPALAAGMGWCSTA